MCKNYHTLASFTVIHFIDVLEMVNYIFGYISLSIKVREDI